MNMQASPSPAPPRCDWAQGKDETYTRYHDEEWGTPSRDDRHLFEMLVLEGFQAGLSWQTILNKRPAFREAFECFDPQKVAAFDEKKLQSLMENPGIIRNRAKIRGAARNARVFLAIQQEYGTFADYLWGHVNHRPVVHRGGPIPSQSHLSEKISQDLKRRGMSFVGPVIIYSFLQAVGVVNDHQEGCFRHHQTRG
jgi:DNA-3-methyladenine glycosylase I